MHWRDGLALRNHCTYLLKLSPTGRPFSLSVTGQDSHALASVTTRSKLWTEVIEGKKLLVYYRPQWSWGDVMFLHVSMILFTGWGPQAHTRGGGGWGVWLGGLQAHTQGGRLRGLAGGSPGPHPRGEVEGSGWGGVSRSTPGGYSSMYWGRPLPPRRRLLLRAVRILLECIPFYISFRINYSQ